MVFAHVGEVIADDELLTLAQRLFKLARGGIPLKDAGVLAFHPLGVLVQAVRAVAGQGFGAGDHVVVFQRLDELKTLGDFLGGVVELAVGNPILAVNALQIVDHQDHLVVSAQRQRIVVLAQLLGEDRAGGHQLFQRDRGRKAGLLKGGLVPVEDTAGHRHRDGQKLAVDGALGKRLLVELGQIDDVRDLIEIVELAAAVRVGEGVQPVPVDLVHVEGGIRGEILAHLVFPAAPRAVGALHVNAGRGLESLDGLLGRFVAGVAAPPREGQGAFGQRANGGQRQRQRQQACDHLFHHKFALLLIYLAGFSGAKGLACPFQPATKHNGFSC